MNVSLKDAELISIIVERAVNEICGIDRIELETIITGRHARMPIQLIDLSVSKREDFYKSIEELYGS